MSGWSQSCGGGGSTTVTLLSDVSVPEQCEAPAAVPGSLDAVRRLVQLLHQHLLRQEPVSYKKTMNVNIILRIR